MHSDLISKIEKARQYATQPERVSIRSLTAAFRGGNNDHHITVTDGVWSCDCDFFKHHAACAHVMAMQKILDPMLSAEAREAKNPLDDETYATALA